KIDAIPHLVGNFRERFHSSGNLVIFLGKEGAGGPEPFCVATSGRDPRKRDEAWRRNSRDDRVIVLGDPAIETIPPFFRVSQSSGELHDFLRAQRTRKRVTQLFL